MIRVYQCTLYWVWVFARCRRACPVLRAYGFWSRAPAGLRRAQYWDRACYCCDACNGFYSSQTTPRRHWRTGQHAYIMATLLQRVICLPAVFTGIPSSAHCMVLNLPDGWDILPGQFCANRLLHAPALLRFRHTFRLPSNNLTHFSTWFVRFAGFSNL